MSENRPPRFSFARLTALAGLVLLTAVPAALPTPAAAATASRCRPVSVPAPVADQTATLRGTLCLPSGQAPDTVQLLLAGATFDQAYWLTPADTRSPSYVRYMAEAGYAVLALDRPGTGLSDRTPAAATDLGSEAGAVHEVVGRLRTGAVDGHAYRRVIGVGHSFGSSVLLTEAARNGDLDALAVTGFVHSVGPRLEELNEAIVPAADDPLLGLSRPPSGYLTTKTGSRADLFLDRAGVSPLMPSVIELTKTTMTTGEQATLAEAGDPAISGAVRVPVFLAVGGHDDLFCNGPYLQCTDAEAVKTWESWFFPPEAHLETFVLDGAGHALNLHRNATAWFAAAREWLDGLSR
ncbi:alpha/beta hydrolase [Sphaerimonospora sp. CA-214678]|uniref:alpha/beta hydrolase n=1 Tax=Sphaerimonospora sp. CA-214678 TaxID=3240029 RepID=UPI003D912DDE